MQISKENLGELHDTKYCNTANSETDFVWEVHRHFGEYYIYYSTTVMMKI